MTTFDEMSQSPRVTPEEIEAGIRRGRKERSAAFWAMLQAVFAGRSDREGEGDRLPEAKVGPQVGTLAGVGNCA